MKKRWKHKLRQWLHANRAILVGSLIVTALFSMNLKILSVIFAVCFIGYGALMVVKRQQQHIIQISKQCNELQYQLEEKQVEYRQNVALVAHQLKTPVAAIRGYLDLATDELGTGSAGLERIVQKMHLVSRDMVAVLDEYSGLLKKDKTQVVYEKQKCVIGRLVEDAHSRIAKNELISCEGETQISLSTDKEKITQVITLLLENAIKYGNKKPVTVKIKKEKNIVHLIVRDQGIGLKPEEIQKVFRKYHRTKQAQKTADGSGIGLCVAKNITQQLGGSLSAESDGPKKGCTMSLKLPLNTKNT